jgi:hypothetical protein
MINGYSKSIEDLKANVKKKWKDDIELWKLQPDFKRFGMPTVTMTLRSLLCQLALISQGRESLSVVNGKRIKAGMPLIKLQENAKVSWIKPENVTKAPHCLGIAIDFFLDSNEDGKIDSKDWSDVDGFISFGKFMESRGWTWGGSFKTNKDFPHLQYDK